MKVSNTHVGIAIKNFLQRQVLPDTRELYTKVNKKFNTIVKIIKGGSEFNLLQLGRVEWVKRKVLVL